jgi:4-hydroxy-4-methyl-2-oxoglutarate aldolase
MNFFQVPRDVGEKLFSGLLSDALDALGVFGQVMKPAIRPLDESRVMFGKARTAIYIEVAEVVEGRNPYIHEIELVDSLRPGDVAVMACGGSERIAPWGSLLSTAAQARGAVGCVTDGLVRDINSIRKMGFPVYHNGIAPLDSRGRGEVREIDCAVYCGGVRVVPNDLVFGDADGIVVIPQAAANDVVEEATRKLRAENNSLSELRAGAFLSDVFARYGVL